MDYSYDATGTVTQITDPYGGATRFTVDETGRVTEEIDPNGNVTRLLTTAWVSITRAWTR